MLFIADYNGYSDSVKRSKRDNLINLSICATNRPYYLTKSIFKSAIKASLSQLIESLNTENIKIKAIDKALKSGDMRDYLSKLIIYGIFYLIIKMMNCPKK